MKNPYEAYVVREDDFGIIKGYRVLVSEWSDRVFTVHASRVEMGAEDVILDGDTEYEMCPVESEIADRIEEILEDRFDAAHA